MSFIKKNTVSSVVVVASSVYFCTRCDHTEIVKDDDMHDNKKCPKCEADMVLISTSAGDAKDLSPEDKTDKTDKTDETDKTDDRDNIDKQL